MAAIDEYELSRGTSYCVARGWGCNLFSWIVDARPRWSAERQRDLIVVAASIA